MAELSTLPSSPPLTDPLLPKSDSQMDSVPPIPKSSLYGNKTASAAPPEFQVPLDIQASPDPSPSKAVPQNAAPSSVQDPPLPGQDPGSNDKTSPLQNNLQQTENHVCKEMGAAGIPNVSNSQSPEIAPTLYPSVQFTQSSENVNVQSETPQIAPLSDSVCAKMDEEDLTKTPPPLQVVQEVTVTRESLNPPVSQLKPEGEEPETEGSPSVPVINEPEVMSSGSPTLPPPHPVMPRPPAPDTLSYLESASLMSGTMESLSGLGEDGSSIGSDSEINGLAVRRTDKYGFLGGSQYSESGEKEVRVEVSRQREMKWLDMFNHWDKWVKHRFQKVKMRCRKGIPSSLRAKAWQLLSNSEELLHNNPGKFEELEREQGEAKWLDIIEKDLHRQFPFHEMFAARGGHGQQDLFRILKAYTVYRPDEGYCQAQAPVAAVLLMHMPAEQAFWCLVQICEKYLPGYYSAGLEAIQLDGEMFFSLLRRTCPMAYRHLKKFKIDPILYMTEWFMCIFSRTLPWSCVLRVWDMFFCEGVKIVFRVGLVLLKQMLGSVDKLRELQGMYETMERLRNISPDMIREDMLVQEIVSLPVTEALIERECSIQVRKWRESRGELTHEPGRRLHGTRHIYEYKRRASSLASGGSFSFLGSPIPPPGPLRASSSLLSLPGFRRSKTPFTTQPKKTSFSGPSRAESPPQSPPASGLASNKPPLPPSKPTHVQSPLATTEIKTEANKAQNTLHTSNTLTPSPKIVSEQITPKIPSPTANNAPLPPCPVETKREVTAATPKPEEEEAKKGGKKTKEEKKREKEDERKRMKEKREKEKAEKERLKKEKERQERERKRSLKKKQHGSASGGGGEEPSGAAAAKDAAV
ncbi:TBC1 domain family member 10A-like [Periophthalmus magnuspinnatus]|uniref:TBC1 domain family member 10A-like n=1 Tax=Periophthalmus magnuspinnatus TaxID=409849 RepID=UPI00145AEFAF|nr:TBC1 domain family member 10A-like [Periophthalmus magnuspinnatus]